MLVVLAAAALSAPAVAQSAQIAGTAYMDTNRDGERQISEGPFADHRIDLYDAAGPFLATTLTDASGRYQFSSLTDGDYRVEYDASHWWNMRDEWVPTTTASLFPSRTVRLAGEAVADLGWRPIIRSTDVNAPVSSHTGPNGLVVGSYDDVVSAREIYDALMQSSLVGEEAARTTIRFDYGSGSSTATSVTQSNGKYVGYRANVQISYVSWLDNGDSALFHEYGHAWGLYYAYMVQQDPSLSGYLAARGLTNDPRLGSSYPWDRDEMIAEDYRQLFGTANARRGGQLNGDIPLAPDVPGLRDYLAGAFRQPPLPELPPVAPFTVSGLTVAPDPVKTAGTVSFTASGSASVTVKVLNAKGSLVRVLLSNATTPAGPASAIWDRTDAAGRRVKRGTYSVKIDAVGDDGRSASASKAFSVY